MKQLYRIAGEATHGLRNTFYGCLSRILFSLFCVVTSAVHVESFSSQEEIEYHCSMYHSANNPPKSMTPAAFDPIFITPSLLFLHLSLSVSLRCKVIVDPLTHSPQRCCGVASRPSIVFPHDKTPYSATAPEKPQVFSQPLPSFCFLAGPVFRSHLQGPPTPGTDEMCRMWEGAMVIGDFVSQAHGGYLGRYLGNETNSWV